MTIVNERQSGGKPTQVDPKTGKPLPPRANSPSVEVPVDNGNSGGFFGSFWASKNKKKMAAMEPPPPTLKASASLSERESVEVEVVSKCCTSGFLRKPMLIVNRAFDYVVLQHREADYD